MSSGPEDFAAFIEEADMGGKETPRQAVEAVWSYLQTEFPGWPLRDGGSHPARGGRIFGIGSQSIWVSDGFFDADTDQSPPRQRLRRWDLAAAIRDAGSDTVVLVDDEGIRTEAVSQFRSG